MAVVRNHDQHALVVAEIILQPVDRFEVEVIGGLVEQQRGRAAEESLGQQHADLLAALQLAHAPFMQGGFHAQPVEQHGGVGFGRVAALFAHDAFELAEAHAVVIGELVVRLGVQRVAFFERPPERRIAHDDGVDHAKSVERELVLAQHAEFLGTRDRPFGRLQLAREDLHQRRFSGAVGTRDGITAPGKKGAGDVLKQNSGAEAHGDVLNGKQGYFYNTVSSARPTHERERLLLLEQARTAAGQKIGRRGAARLVIIDTSPGIWRHIGRRSRHQGYSACIFSPSAWIWMFASR